MLVIMTPALARIVVGVPLSADLPPCRSCISASENLARGQVQRRSMPRPHPVSSAASHSQCTAVHPLACKIRRPRRSCRHEGMDGHSVFTDLVRPIHPAQPRQHSSSPYEVAGDAVSTQPSKLLHSSNKFQQPTSTAVYRRYLPASPPTQPMSGRQALCRCASPSPDTNRPR